MHEKTWNETYQDSQCVQLLLLFIPRTKQRQYKQISNTHNTWLPLIKGKTTWTTDKIFICLGIENRDEYIKLSANNKNIYHIDQTNLLDIQPVADT